MSLRCAICGSEMGDIMFSEETGYFICKFCLIVYRPDIADKLPEDVQKRIFRRPDNVVESQPDGGERGEGEHNGREIEPAIRDNGRIRRRFGALLFFKSYDRLLDAVRRADEKYLRPDLIPVNAPDKLTIDLCSRLHEKVLKVIVWGEAECEEEYRDFIEKLFDREVKKIVYVRPEDFKPVKCFHIGHYRLDSFLAS